MVQFNSLLIAFLAVFILRSLFQYVLNRINIAHLRQRAKGVPEILQGAVEEEKMGKMTAYSVDSAHFDIVETLFSQALLLAIVLSGFLPWLAETVKGWQPGFIVGGMVFFTVLAAIGNLFRVPFDLYDTFVIEDRYGFNTKTLRLWLIDWIKSIALSAVLGGIVLLSLLALINYFKNTWWLLAWVMVGVFRLLMLWLFPVVIAPLFNKFEPIPNKELEHRIASLMGRVGLQVGGVFQMDAGKQSKHTNAYFTGFGKTKRIVLFDTLLASHPDEEILAILAHEVGHWRGKHMLKTLVFAQALSFIGFCLVSRLMHWPFIYQTFGFQESILYIGLFLAATMVSPLGFFVRAVESALSRKFECAADNVALELMGTFKPMYNALIRLAIDNLANLFPHPLYAWFYYSHPPLVERISRLKAMSGEEK